MFARVLRPTDPAWDQTIGLTAGDDIAAWQVGGELGPQGLAWDSPPGRASGPVADQTVRFLAGVWLQPYQICFLSEPATRLNQARPDWWRRNVATFLGDRPVLSVTQRGRETVRHTVAVPFEVPELWARSVALPAAFRGGNVVFVPAEYSVDTLLDTLLEQRNLDRATSCCAGTSRPQ